MTAIYADNLARSRSDSFRGIAGRGAAMQAMTRDRNDIKCHICGRVRHLKSKCPLRFKHQQQNDGQQPQQREEHQNNPRRQHQRKNGGGRGPVWCAYHKTATHTDDNCRARRRKRAVGNAHIAATGPSRVKRSCRAYDLQEEDDQPECPYISFTAKEVHPTAANAAEQSHKVESWPFGSLLASRPWPFEEQAKPAISFGGQEKSEFSYMYGGTDGEGKPLYGKAPTESEPAEIERKPHERGNVVTVLVDSGASGHCFDDLIIPELKHRLQDYTSLSTPRMILTSWGSSPERHKLDLSADGYAGKELAINAVANAQVWHRRHGHLNMRNLELMNRNNSNAVAFDGSITDCDVCAVGKSHQQARPRKAKHVTLYAPFRLVYGDLTGPFKPTAHGGFKLSARSPTSSPSGPQSTFSAA